MNTPDPERTLPVDEAVRVAALRDAFEQSWEAGPAPRLEDFLVQVEERLRGQAFREFLKTETKWRRGRREPVAASDYLNRFPQFEVAIRELCPAWDQGQTANDAELSRLAAGFRVRCPHCHNPVELVPEAPLESIRCTVCGSDFSLTSDENEATRDARQLVQIGHFKLVERLGMGAFGTVWKAQDIELDRTIALKIPRTANLDKYRQDLFLREARSAAQLRHPNIVSVYEVGRDGDTLYIVSELVRGISLADRLTAGPLAAREAAELCATIADALHHAHEHGVIHRDLKPANVMLDAAGEPHLMDFGLARREAHEITMTLEGQVLGTPAYMSPEQAQGEAHVADRRSDVYSLGVMLFEMLTGELPFRGNARMMIHQVIHEEPPNPRKLNASVPKDLDTLTMRCLQKAPTRRFEAASEFGGELRRYLAGEPIRSRPITQWERAWRWCKRAPVVASLSAAVVGLLALLAIAGPITAVRESRLRQKAEIEEGKAGAANRSLRNETATLLYLKGNADYAAGRLQTGCEEIFRAWQMWPEGQPAKLGNERVLADRLTRGQRSFQSLPVKEGASIVAFRPDGAQVVTGSWNGIIRRWDAVTGRPLGEVLRDDSQLLTRLAFSGDGAQILTASFGARLWDAATGKPLSKPMRHTLLREHYYSCADAAFTPDGARALICTSPDFTSRLWDVATAQPLGEPMQHDDALYGALSRDGARVLTIVQSESGGARLWDAATGQRLSELKGSFWCGAFSPDGARVLTGSSGGTARLWDVLTGQPLGEPMRHEARILCVTFGPDGAQVLTGSEDGAARLWDAASGQPLGEPMRHDGLGSLAFSPDGAQVLIGAGNAARMWDAKAGQPLVEARWPGPLLLSATFSPDGTRVVTISQDYVVQLWDAATLQPVGEPMRHEGEPMRPEYENKNVVYSAAFSPDGSRLITGSSDRTARLWDAATGRPVGERMKHEDAVTIAAFSPDGARVLTASVVEPATVAVYLPDQTLQGDPSAVRLWDAKTGRPLGAPMRHESLIQRAAFSRDGTRVLTASDDGTARVWDGRTGQPMSSPLRHEDKVTAAAFSPDGARVVTGSLDGRARLWDAATGKPLCEPLRHEGQIMSVAFSPDGARVLTGCLDGTARLWDAMTGRALSPPMRLEGDNFTSAEFSPDGAQVLTYGNASARVWETATGQPVGEPIHHAGGLSFVAFNRDGMRLLTGGGSTAQLWDAATGQSLGEPLRHEGRIVTATFIPDGSRVLIVSEDGAARLWDIAVAPLPRHKMAWFELLLSKRLDNSGQLVDLSADEITARWNVLEQDQEWRQKLREFRNSRRLVTADGAAD